jgi:hypothetical protein
MIRYPKKKKQSKGQKPRSSRIDTSLIETELRPALHVSKQKEKNSRKMPKRVCAMDIKKTSKNNALNAMPTKASNQSSAPSASSHAPAFSSPAPPHEYCGGGGPLGDNGYPGAAG